MSKLERAGRQGFAVSNRYDTRLASRHRDQNRNQFRGDSMALAGFYALPYSFGPVFSHCLFFSPQCISVRLVA
ncbi:hypothetical protein [Mesorhizobium sp. M0306]|uniref:hypothetical protein n=1 Tax=unclassified Mesorhizobium TaxID=325217 RepID=UPI00333A9904